MRILQLCPRVPFPPHDGGAIAMYDVAAGLSQAGHEVTVLAANTPKHRQPATALSHLPAVRLVTVDVDTRLSPWKALRNLAVGKVPYNVERFISPALTEKLRELLTTESFDVVQIEGTFVAWYVDVVRQAAPQVPVVLRAHNLEYNIWEMLAGRERNPLKKWYLHHLARGLRTFEHRYLPRFTAVAAITEPDQQRLRAVGCPEPVAFVPAGVDLTRFQPEPAVLPQPRTLCMIGSLNWLPNLEGLDWFLTHVWPRLTERLPELELHVAGTGMPERLRQLRLPGVTMHGFVESAADFMRAYELMLVPLLSGGGMRVKIIEGMALGKGILSTALGAEGIHCRPGHDILLADDPEEWVRLLEDYYHGRLDVAGIGARAAQAAAELYDNRRVVARFEQLYQQVAAQRPVSC
ncbi:glycosyltransferase [Hymenobacter lutimineralis]|uniref:Glycosyltransferase n=1 Tax=Hymenobacter lutimineralis TaxID=2606448 RepID=A0A5D6V0D8_9BACT|nr:glycosyltransferase family 4 protein [Hymenobacter lutimineralis]TYZ08074.1 glycosyltransferase [Hymenobacter lutimineralis]